MLGSDPAAELTDLPDSPTPAASLAWARTMTSRHTAQDRYRPMPPVGYWGRMLDPAVMRASGAPPDAAATPLPGQRRVAEMRRRPRARQAPDDEDDAGTGTWIIRADEPLESVEDPFGMQRPIDRDDNADPDGLGDSLADLPEARIVRTPEQAREVLRSGDEMQSDGRPAPTAPPPRGIVYPEWDHRVGRYRVRGAIVRDLRAPLGDSGWADSALARHARLVRRVRARFERLRPRPMRLDRQPDGPEVDITAYVTAAADLRAGTSVDGRMYMATRPARRELAVALLLDVSASTDSWVTSDRRIVDVEKEALLVVCEALDALGDRYGVFAFSGESAEDVSVLSLKAFDEKIGPDVRRRIAALDADRYTRIGAPIRHLTAALGRERAPRRLLLILSDGKPNDVDLYEGQYGIEDARQAIAEARRQGVAVFCLTVDREAPRYAGRVFGRGAFAVLHRADQLPAVLIEVLRELIRT
jgi:nitric oxide reductase NorD protein